MFNDAAIERIERSIAKHGQLRPVCVIPDVAADRYILIDGYLRLEACKRRGLDSVLAVCQSDEKQALLSVLIGDQQRPLQAIEQAGRVSPAFRSVTEQSGAACRSRQKLGSQTTCFDS
jgi:ParB/RepB/Spo0J family partition protein